MSKNQTARINQKSALLIMAVAVVVFTWATNLALHRQINGTELNIFRAINNLSDSWRVPFLIITQFGSVWALLAFGGVFVLKRRYNQALEFLLAGSVSFCLVELAKHFAHRVRPDYLLPLVHQRELFVSGYGFPSGHTAMAVVLSLLALPFLPKAWLWLPFAWIGLVALSRLYLGVHAPLDIIGGLAIGGFVWAGLQIIDASSLLQRAKNHRSNA